MNEAYTLVYLPDDTKVLFLLNQCFLDRNPDQTESLLQPHQARAFGVIVDDCSSGHICADGLRGSQSITVGDKVFKMHFLLIFRIQDYFVFVTKIHSGRNFFSL